MGPLIGNAGTGALFQFQFQVLSLPSVEKLIGCVLRILGRERNKNRNKKIEISERNKNKK